MEPEQTISMDRFRSRMQRLDLEERLICGLMIMGSGLYLAFYVLDSAVYPQHAPDFLVIRVLVVMLHVLVIVDWLRRGYNVWGPLIYLVSAAVGISVMCYWAGDGFASVYFAGIMVVVIGGGILVRFSDGQFLLTMLLVAGQHFVLQLFLNVALQPLLATVFFLASSILVSAYIRYSFRRMQAEIKSLQGLLPICTHCSSIRTDSGDWDRLEVYLASRSELPFAQAICPDCMRKQYAKH